MWRANICSMEPLHLVLLMQILLASVIFLNLENNATIC